METNSSHTSTRSLLDHIHHGAVELEAPLDTPSWPSRRHQPHQPEREEKYLAIGIDFGTTQVPACGPLRSTGPVLTVDSHRYSGVSWAYSATPDDIHHVAHWPYDGQRGKDEVQIPTQVDLETKDWGYLVSKDADPIRWFKLLLLETKDLKRDMMDPSVPLEDSREKLRKHSGSEPGAVIGLIAGFLQKLWEHTLEEIKHEVDIDLLPIKVAITVPAIWPLYARQKMEEAAKRAGILKPRRVGTTKLILVEEPEAAAVSTLFDRRAYPEIEVHLLRSYCFNTHGRSLTSDAGWRVVYRLRLWRRHGCRRILSWLSGLNGESDTDMCFIYRISQAIP